MGLNKNVSGYLHDETPPIGLLNLVYSDGTFMFDDWLDKETLLKEYLAQVLRTERLNYTNIFHDKYYKMKGH